MFERLVANAVQRITMLMAGVVLVACAGCSNSSTSAVNGVVHTQDGAPLIGATVIAREKKAGNSVRGDTDAEGHFALKAETSGTDIPPGEYSVVVVEHQSAIEADVPPSISPKYQFASSSGLSFTVEPGQEKQLDWKLDAP